MRRISMNIRARAVKIVGATNQTRRRDAGAPSRACRSMENTRNDKVVRRGSY